MSRHWSAPLSALLLVGVVIGAGVGPAAGAEVYPVDGDHALTTDAAIAEFEEEGVVTRSLPVLNASLTVAEDASAVGLDDWGRYSSTHVYFRLQYHEAIPRTLRIYLPEAYFSPRIKEGLEDQRGGPPASLSPVNNDAATKVTVTLDGPQTVVYELPKSRGTVADVRSGLSDLLGNATGISAPSIGAGQDTEWQYIQSDHLAQNTTYALDTNGTDITMQYNVETTGHSADGEATWLSVQECDSTDSAPVCTFTRQGEPNTTYVLSQTTDPPQVRYVRGTAPAATGSSVVSDLATAVDRLTDDIAGLFGGS